MALPPDRNVVVGRTSSPDTARLRRVLQDLTSPEVEDVLAEMSSLRNMIASPLTSQDRGPSPEDRQKLQGAADVVVMIPSSEFREREGMREVRLSADLISVALSLASELQINELDAAVLLYDAQTRAAQRPDGNVVAAAKDIYCGRRVEQVLYVQEVLRAPLNEVSYHGKAEQAFASFVTERDLLIAQESVVIKVLDRLELGLDAMQKSGANAMRTGSQPKHSLLAHEASSLAECIFLATYTVQMTATEAIRIRTVLKKADEIVTKFETVAKQEGENQRWANSTSPGSRKKSKAHLEALSVQNLLFLAWICALDRSRYQDVYDTRERSSSVNKLLLDDQFIRRSMTLPAFSENETLAYSPVMAAAELTAAVFRLATRSPDEDEAIFSALRVCVHADALQYLSKDLPDWIASCLSQDVDLYGDAFEDLVLDVSEASSLTASLLQVGLSPRKQALANTPPELAFSPPSHPRRTSGGKPPLARKSHESSSSAQASGLYGMQASERGHSAAEDRATAAIVKLCGMVERAMQLAPQKLQIPSAGGGLKYWTAVGDNVGGGILPRAAETISEAAETAEASGTDDERICKLVHAFLGALRASCVNAPHAFEAFGVLRSATYNRLSLRWAFDALSSLYHQPLSAGLGSQELEERSKLEKDLCAIFKVAGAMGQTVESGAIILDMLVPREVASAAASLFMSNAVGSKLSGGLVETLVAMGDWHTIAAFIDGLAAGDCAILSQSFRAESEEGQYDATISILDACRKAITTKEDTVRAFFAAVERICKSFVVDCVLSGWPRRKYATEHERWRLFSATADLLLALITCDPDATGIRLLAHLLIPAPATGAASQPLRAILSACGARRSPDESEREGDPPGLFRLVKAAENQDAKLYHEIENCIKKAAQILTHSLSLSQARIAKQGLSGATCIELIAGEAQCLSIASTLIYQPDLSNFAMYRAGYDQELVDSMLEMLASTARQSPLVAHFLTHSDQIGVLSIPSSSAMLRTNLANMVTGYIGQSAIFGEKKMACVLKLVESCLGIDGGGEAGLYLLGLSVDANGRLKSVEYGVLDSLISGLEDIPDPRIRSKEESEHSLNLKCKAVAAVFLEQLAVYAAQKTSLGVLEYLRSQKGFATNLLQKMVRYTEKGECGDWRSIGLIAGASMSLAALHIHRFGASLAFTMTIPASRSLLTLIEHVAESGELSCCANVLNKWRMLLTVQFDAGSANTDDETILLVASAFIEALMSEFVKSGSTVGLNNLVGRDGGEALAFSTLTLLTNLSKQIGIRREWEVIGKILSAIVALSSSRVDSPRTRCALYTCIALLGGDVLRKMNDTLQVGHVRRDDGFPLSNIDRFISIACSDAVTGPSAAGRATAMAAVATMARIDPKATVPALARNNRLRKVLSSSLCESRIKLQILKACTQSYRSMTGMKAELGRAATVIAQAGMAVVHAVAAAAEGPRALADGACIECAASLLTVLDSAAGTGSAYESKSLMDAESELFPESTAQWVEDENYLIGNGGTCGAFEQRISITGCIAAAVSAMVVQSNMSLIDGALAAVEAGKNVFEEVLKSQRHPRVDFLNAASAVTSLVSRMPNDVVASVAVTAHLRAVAARCLTFILPAQGKVGPSRSLFSVGIKEWTPSTPKKVRRATVYHPEGGSLFERDVICARINGLYSLSSCIRGADDLTATFRARLTLDEDDEFEEGTNRSDITLRTANPRGILADVLRIAAASITEARRTAEEAVRVLSLADGDALAARSSKQLQDLRAYCCEEFGYSLAEMDHDVLRSCLAKCSEQSRDLTERCLYIMECCLFILKEFAVIARRSVAGGGVGRDRVDGALGILSIEEAKAFLSDAKRTLMPLCRTVDAIPDGVWGEHSASFAKQLGRLIRTSVGG